MGAACRLRAKRFGEPRRSDSGGGTERAAHLVEYVFPDVPVRQWVLTLPPRVRYVLAWDHALCRAVVAVYIVANLAAASAWIDARRDVLSWTPPRGGLLALLKYNLPVDSLTLADALATEHSVMLAPGSAFGYEHHLRLGIGQRPDLFATGLVEAGKGLDRFADRR